MLSLSTLLLMPYMAIGITVTALMAGEVKRLTGWRRVGGCFLCGLSMVLPVTCGLLLMNGGM